MRFLWRSLCIFALACCFSSGALAQDPQEETGSIKGTVYDSSGAIVANARVVVAKEGDRQSTDSDAQGNYAIDRLPVGSYSVTITAEGYKPFEKENVDVRNGDDAHVDANLDPEPADPNSGQMTALMTFFSSTELASWLL